MRKGGDFLTTMMKENTIFKGYSTLMQWLKYTVLKKKSQNKTKTEPMETTCTRFKVNKNLKCNFKKLKEGV